MTPLASTTVTVIHDADARDGDVGAGGDDGARPGDGDRRPGDADGDGDVLLVHQRDLHGTGGGDVGPVRRWTGRGRGRDGVPADAAERVGTFAFQATYSGDGTYDRFDRRV